MVSNQKLFLLGLPPTSRALSGNLLPWPPPLSSEGLYRGNHVRSSQVLTTTEVSPLHQQNPPFPTCRWEKLQLLKTVTKIEKPRVFVALAATERFPGKPAVSRKVNRNKGNWIVCNSAGPFRDTAAKEEGILGTWWESVEN